MKSCSWCSKVTCIIYISERTSIIFLVIMRLLRKTQVLVQREMGGEGGGGGGAAVPAKITVGVCSMLPESRTLPQTKIRDLPCLTSALKRRVIKRNITYSRALFQRGKAYSVSLQKGVNSRTLYNLSRAI